MRQPRGRYVKLNYVDYFLIALAVLLALALLLRGIFYYRDQNEDRSCEANVGFVIRAVDMDTVNELQEGAHPFLLPDGTPLPETRLAKITQTEEYVPDDDGNMQPVVSALSYDVHISFTAEGSRAKDNTFLLGGVRRLAAGDRLTLTRDGRDFSVDFVTVQVF